ncbi:deoxyuridine 5'-triphosphate nucleotidohydrolase like protein [Zymoseptoria brevis]|uniref:Deoxyuridine 5'-triphosphate nucleotidohydrolase like protein n=1 Tax=Zymoseptoria brevis TaxID=1047168 RepID=A0A0F4G3Z3_9PEZI|nr:deoxyuridine 5'-triphosphate nucleotidohydrolase like protein [Zymoseptoria brevis]
MILSGLEIVTRSLVRNLRNAAHQQQPCGVDLTLRQISKWNSPATIDFDNTHRDFDNTHRKAAETISLPFDETAARQSISLQPGAYLVDFNETVKIPLDCMATVFPRSSLWRSGVSVSSGVVDAGYEGGMGALLEVKNPAGVILFEEMKGAVEGYKGVYQGSTSSAGQSGVGL